MMRWDVLNYFIKKYEYKDYLEIGYYKGWSFDRVESKFKTAVDPNPSKTPEQESWVIGKHNIGLAKVPDEKGKIIVDFTIFKLTSDEFFTQVTPSSKWDIIFVDGLHEAKQAYKDIQNAFEHLSPGGVVIVHDCNPPTYAHTTTGVDGCWNGDVYKAFIWAKFSEGIDSITVDTDWGVGILRRNEYEDIEWVNPDEFGPIEWDEFDKNRSDALTLLTLQEWNQYEEIVYG